MANFQGLALACVEAIFCKEMQVHTPWKALDKIYQIYIRPLVHMRLLGEENRI